MDTDVTLDTTSLYCPVPLMLATEKLKDLKKGQVLEILADDPEAIEDIPKLCKITKNKFLKVENDKGVYKFYIQKVVKRSAVSFQ